MPEPVFSRKALVVDDQEELAQVITLLLERKDFVVSCTASALDALDILTRSGAELDILITDLAMPEMDGNHLAKSARQNNPGIKILFISGNALTLATASELRKPGNAVLAKPFTSEEIVAAVERLVPATGSREKPKIPG